MISERDLRIKDLEYQINFAKNKGTIRTEKSSQKELKEKYDALVKIYDKLKKDFDSKLKDQGEFEKQFLAKEKDYKTKISSL